MTSTRRHLLNPLAHAAWLCLAALPMTLPAFAQNTQTASADSKEKPEEIVVTGSRIRGIAPIGPSVTGVTRDSIETSGAVSTAQILQQLPQVFNLGFSESSRGQGGAGNITYGSAVNIRGIGPFATLTLINGHRSIGQGTSAATVDPSIIPMLALERIEVVADGASAIYGSDAVAGVANLIMRRNEKGVQAMMRFGKANGYDERQVGALWGTRWANGQATLTFENSYKSALNGADRDFFTGNLTAQGGGDFRSTQCAPGNVVISGVSYAIPAGGVTKAGAATLVAGTANKCDNSKVQDLLPKQDRNSFAFTLNHDLGRGISVYADGFASRREFMFKPAALAANLTVPSTNPFYVRPAGAPAGTSETVAYSFINELPQNRNEGFSRSMQATGGVDFEMGSGWKSGVLYTYGSNTDYSVTSRGLNNAAITAALANTDPATALNVFGSGSNSPATLAAISNQIAYSPGTTRFHNVQAKADGPLFALPAGQVRTAVGYEGQILHTVGGQTTGPATAPVFGEVQLERTVNSLYGEVVVPVFGGSFTAPGVRKLDLSAAIRGDNYSDVGKTSNPKWGLNWTPVDGLTFKASYGTSFRAPGLTQIRGFTNGGRGGLFVQNYSDPTNGGALRVGVALSAANQDLKPETAKTRSLGFDWQPAIGNKTRISMNWFDITYDNQITGYLSDLTVLNREAAFAGTPIIQRNPSAALQAQLLAQYPINGVPPANWTLFVDGRQFNLAKSVSQGYDFQASTRLATDNFGGFQFGLSGTVFTKYDVNLTPAGAPVSQLNTIYNPLKFKARGSVNWNIGGWFSTVVVNYQNAYDNNLANPVQRVAAFTSLDARVAYTLERDGWLRDTTVALGVSNLFDKKPPFVNIAQSSNGGGGFDPTLASPIGRIVSLSLDKKF
jgi:iron complex outermembrane receptor protein